MPRWQVGHRAVIASAIGALLGIVLFTVVAGWVFFGNTQTALIAGMNGCLPPCPHSTATYHEDRSSGRRWISISTVDENGTPMPSGVIDEPPFGGTLSDLVPIALIGAASGGIVGFGVSLSRPGVRSAV